MAPVTASRPKVCIVGAGAAGLWCAIRLVERGWGAGDLFVVEPDAKTGNDHTWSYWLREPLLPASVPKQTYGEVELAADGRRRSFATAPYWYESVRSSAFYAYAKDVLAKAGAHWITGTVTAVASYAAQKVEVSIRPNTTGAVHVLDVDYVLDSRPPVIDVRDARYLTTLQHFGGRFVRFASDVLDVDAAVFMDFVEADGEVAFFYVLPQSTTVGLVEMAVFGKVPWTHARYDRALDAYMEERFRKTGKAVAYDILEAEYGVIPMTDRPLWRDSEPRVWKIGTAGGWVQPSSGYAFTRSARFAGEVAAALSSDSPRPWRPSAVQQVFNSTMLGYIIDEPGVAGQVFFDLFARNGAARTFSFLDEGSAVSETLKLMWNSPKRAFVPRALTETARRLVGAK